MIRMEILADGVIVKSATSKKEVINDASTTIKELLKKQIFVPEYQRAYSWDNTRDDKGYYFPSQQNFLSTLIEHIFSSKDRPYYFGQFIFEKSENEEKFGVIDGQQRLTTIVILISVLNNLLCQTVKLTEEEKNDNLSLLTKNFTTVDSDNQLFKDYIVNLIGLRCTIKPETDSQNLIVDAFDYFRKQLYDKRYKDLKNLLNAVQNATCTIHMVNNKTDAIQMYEFQNYCVNVEKLSNIELIKAQFMFNIHLYGGNEKDKMIGEVDEVFKNIYKFILKFEKKLLKNEDEVLRYTQRIYFNILRVYSIEKISAELSELSNSERINFIKKFTCTLKSISEYIPDFFKKEKESIIIHSFVAALLFSKQDLIDIVMLFICKAYSLGFKIGEIEQLCKRLESIIVRDNAIVLLDGLCDHLGVIYETFGKEDGAEENLKKMDNEIKKLKKILI